MIRFISDLHEGHENVIKFDNRPFKNIDEMREQLIERWNSVVGNRDTTYILGDFCWRKESDPLYSKFLNALNGKKILVRGNHDPQNLPNGFTEVVDYKEIKDNKRRIIMSHYPMIMYHHDIDENAYMLYGHVHSTNEFTWVDYFTRQLVNNHATGGNPTGHLLNVGAMMPYMNYTPRTLDELIEVGKEIYGWKV